MPSVKKDSTRRQKVAALRKKAHKGKQAPQKKKAPASVRRQYTIDCSVPAVDSIMDVAAFEKFLMDRIKVGGKPGALGAAVKVTRDETSVHVDAVQPFSKRYLKYLTKKFLKKNSIRDWLRVVADGKDTYKLKYYNIQDENDEGSGEEAD